MISVRSKLVSPPYAVLSALMLAICAALFTGLNHAADAVASGQWPQWRGPQANGHAVETEVPLSWTPSSVAWKTALPGRGHSTPVVWDQRMFLTTALEKGRQRVVLCLDTRDGRLLWDRVAWTGDPEPSHAMNGWASATCATDGEVVVAFFGRGGLHAYTVAGEPLWSADLGTFEGPWGTSACPILVGDLVIQNGDSDANAFVAAFDRKSGKRVWETKRPDNRGWSTPVLIERQGRAEVVLNGHTGVTAYDPATGKELWFTPSARGRGEPTVTRGGDRLFVVCGLAGDMYALDLVSEPETPARIWSAARRSGRDLPSPAVVGNFVFVSSLNGIASCYDAATGKELWKERLEGQFSSSPIVIGGRILHQNEAGETMVIEPGPTFMLIGRNSVGGGADELFRASLLPLHGRIYARSDRYVYCVQK
ncbi:MAG: PQQ-binding-like beta-propeller repeat protein [Pirellulaceae bacterium]